MALVLMIAAGVLLAFLLLPLLGPIVMVAICIAVLALLGYGIMMSIGAGIAAVDIAKEAAAKAQNAKQLSFKIKVRASHAYQSALSSIEELLALQGLRHSPKGLWYRYILTDRIRNCSMTGIFRVENEQNRENLVKYLQKTVGKQKDSPDGSRAEALCQRILECHDILCSEYRPKQTDITK